MHFIHAKLIRVAVTSAVAMGAFAAHPADADTRESVNRAVALARQGRFEAALVLVDEACRGQTIPECGHNRGVLLAQLQRPDEASRVLGELVRSGRAFPETRLALGEVLLQLGRNNEALAQLDVAIRLRADDPVAHYNRGVALARLGRHREATAAFAVAARLDPRFDRASRPPWRADPGVSG